MCVSTPDHLSTRQRRFFYSRGANCCAEIRLILECDPVGPCRGFEGDCADIIPQFESVQGPYVYGEPPEEHAYLDEYVCHQFPDEENYWDQVLVGLISVAVALPIDLFLARAFEIANEGDAPECWLDAPAGRLKLLIGKDAHRGWHLADPAAPVSDFVLWVVRYSGGETLIQSCFRALDWLVRRYCGDDMPEHAEEAGAEQRRHAFSRRFPSAAHAAGWRPPRAT
jgi:hypothetical protein